jgi:alkylation response protein AidB-like acyl-CoA dehydrogenase
MVDDGLLTARDAQFLLHEWLSVEALPPAAGEAAITRDTIDSVLELAERVAREWFLPHYRDADRQEPTLDATGVHVLPAVREALAQYASVGLFAAGFPSSLEGLGLPYLVQSAVFAQFAAANVATAGYVMLTIANARLIATFGSAAQVEAFARPEIEGRWLGTMCLSEPQAGSSLGDIRTRAEREGEDALGERYRIRGNKMWISGGDHDISENIVHLVLAKVPGDDGQLPEGSRGISLFIVPKHLPDGARNDIAVAGLNHKMGYRGTANCLLNFGEQGGAIGWRVGGLGQGLPQMFQMMNEARIGVGLGAAMLGYRGYRLALRYARERRQGRLPGARDGAPVPLTEHADVRRMLLEQKAYVEGAVALCLYCARLVDEEGEEAKSLLALLTPVAKTWPSEFALAANDTAIQIHGGYGYTRDFDVEQLYRDNRLNAIHEGTTGIQALDLLGRKILRDRGSGVGIAAERIAHTCTRAAESAKLAAHATRLAAAWREILATIAVLERLPEARAFDNATLFLRAFGHVVVAWLWLEQALVAERLGAGDAFLDGKLRACRFFYECELPRVSAWLSVVASASDVSAGLDPETL